MKRNYREGGKKGREEKARKPKAEEGKRRRKKTRRGEKERISRQEEIRLQHQVSTILPRGLGPLTSEK